jgi:hypothetical protein
MGAMLIEGICVLDVAEALLSVDAAAPEQAVRLPEAKIMGVRQAGRVSAFVTLPLEADFTAIPVSPEQLLPETAGLAEVILTLDDFPCCFVEVLGEIAGIVTREDMEKPPARMWLFGILTIVEAYCSRKVGVHFPDRSWAQHVTPARLGKAEALQTERQRRGIPTPLVDCMQLSDKLEILLRVPEMREEFGVSSRREGIRLAKALVTLRNSLAHNQPIVESNWEAIVLAARRLERILTRL